MQQMIDAFVRDPTAGRRTLRAEATWDGVFASGVLRDDRIQGSGGDPLYAEELLEVLAKCLAVDALGHGTHQGVHIDSLRVRVEGEVDFAGSVGLEAPAGFTNIRMDIEVDTDADDPALERLAPVVRRCSIVAQSLAGVPQEFTFRKRVVPFV